MAGLGLALLGGLAKGWGEGQLAAIKAQREEKLKQMEYDRADRLEASRQKFEGEMNRERIASTEKMTQATLDMNKTLANIQEAGANARTATTTGAQLKIADAGNVSAEKIAEGNRLMEQNIANARDETTKKIAQMQADAQKEVNSSFVPMADGTWKLKVGDELRDLGNDPTTGKPLVPLPTDNDTPNMKNYKYLVGEGISPSRAQELAFPEAGKSWADMELELTKAIIGARPELGPPATEEDNRKAGEVAKTLVDNIRKNNQPAGETPPSSGTTPPKAGTPAAEAPKLSPEDTAGLIKVAKTLLTKGAVRSAVIAKLKGEGVTDADIAAAGL